MSFGNSGSFGSRELGDEYSSSRSVALRSAIWARRAAVPPLCGCRCGEARGRLGRGAADRTGSSPPDSSDQTAAARDCAAVPPLCGRRCGEARGRLGWGAADRTGSSPSDSSDQTAAARDCEPSDESAEAAADARARFLCRAGDAAPPPASSSPPSSPPCDAEALPACADRPRAAAAAGRPASALAGSSALPPSFRCSQLGITASPQQLLAAIAS
eukprot:COSAG02_NODE_2760_length_8077_cov_2.993106_8_plen_215_part_00